MATDATTVARALQAILLGPEHEQELVRAEGEFADGTELPRPGSVSRSERATFPKYPAYEVVVAHTGRVSDDDPVGRVHDVDVYVTHVGDDEEALADAVHRLVYVVRRMFSREECGRQRLTMPFLGAAPVLATDEDFSPVARPRDQAAVGRAFVKTGAIRLSVLTIG